MRARGTPPGAAVLAVLALAAASQGSPGGAPLQCGEFSPFRNFCESGPYPMFYPVSMAAALTGFVGKLEMELTGGSGGMRLTCWSLASPPLGNCEGPVPIGDYPKAGDLMRLRCEAEATNGPGLPARVGPDGPWGCSVSFD